MVLRALVELMDRAAAVLLCGTRARWIWRVRRLWRRLQSWQATALSNGWGYGTLGTGSVRFDGAAGFESGIIGLVNKGQPRKLDDWGVLRAWAWGASRALDYLETDPAVDAKKVGVEGHSRDGKAAIVAMALRTAFRDLLLEFLRFGGAEINRRNYGEVLENGTSTDAYHWYAGNLVKSCRPADAERFADRRPRTRCALRPAPGVHRRRQPHRPYWRRSRGPEGHVHGGVGREPGV